MTEHESIERRLDRSEDRINGISREMERCVSIQKGDGVKLEKCDRCLEELKKDIDTVKIKLENKWPNVIASFAGAVIPTLLAALAFWKFVWPIVTIAQAKGM